MAVACLEVSYQHVRSLISLHKILEPFPTPEINSVSNLKAGSYISSTSTLEEKLAFAGLKLLQDLRTTLDLLKVYLTNPDLIQESTLYTIAGTLKHVCSILTLQPADCSSRVEIPPHSTLPESTTVDKPLEVSSSTPPPSKVSAVFTSSLPDGDSLISADSSPSLNPASTPSIPSDAGSDASSPVTSHSSSLASPPPITPDRSLYSPSRQIERNQSPRSPTAHSSSPARAGSKTKIVTRGYQKRISSTDYRQMQQAAKESSNQEG